MAKLKEKIEIYRQRFDNDFKAIVDELVTQDESNTELKEAATCLHRPLKYNARFQRQKVARSHGHRTVDFMRNGQPTEDEVRKSVVLGWCIEILQELSF